MSQLSDTLKGIVEISNGTIRVLNTEKIRGPIIDQLTTTAVSHKKVEMQGMARWLIKMMAPIFGIHCGTVTPANAAYQNRIPAIQIKNRPYPLGRSLFRVALQHEIGAIILLYPNSEHRSRYETILTAAAIVEGYQGFLFFQNTRAAAKTFCSVTLETLLKKSRDNSRVKFSFSENLHGSQLAIHTTVFSTEMGLPENQGEFLWQLPERIEDEISNKTTEKLETHFGQCNVARTTQQILNQLKPIQFSCTLRDEIRAAIEELPAHKTDPLLKALTGSENNVQ